MTARLFPAPLYAALRNATRRAVEMVGPLEEIAAHTRIGKTQIHRCYAPAEDGAEPVYLPIDVALDLDQLAGEPVVLRALAGAAGYDIASRAKPVARDTVMGHLRTVIRESADVTEALANGMADGRMDCTDCRAALREVDHLMHALLNLQGTLIAHQCAAGGAKAGGEDVL